MMLRSNLATRPFYNERLVTIAIGVVALIAVLLIVFNATRILALSGERAGVQARIAADRTEADRISHHAAAMQKGIDRPTLARLAASTREANDLIEQRTFSWSALFARLERTLPLDVRLLAVSPQVGENVLKVSMTVVAKQLDDVAEFIDNLTDTGAFYDVQPTQQQLNDDDTYTATVDASYLPSRDPKPAGSTSISSTAPVTPEKPAQTGGR
jgi:Tfp pilus assembly protein PilN